MKKSLLHLVPLMALVLAPLSCAKEKLEGDASALPDGTGVAITVRATVPVAEDDSDAVRTYMDENTILWQTGDQMALAITPSGAAAQKYVSNGLSSTYDGQSQAIFSFTLNPIPAEADSYLYQGIHPASALVDNSDLTACRVVLPSVQNASGTDYDPDAYIMVAAPQSLTSVEDWTVSFRRAVALNELTLKNLPDAVVKVEIIAPEGVSLAGGRYVNLTTGASGTVYEGSRMVEISYATPLSSGDQTIRFASWGATIAVDEVFTVLVYTSTKSYAKAVTLPAGHPITFEENKLNRLTVDMDAELAAVVQTDRLFSGGNGTAALPWRIASTTDLTNLASYLAAGADKQAALEDDYYLQTADIDFNNGYLEAIGNTNTSPYSYFKGTYNGNGYKVSNAKIRNQQTDKAVGFFGYLAASAHIDGLCLENCTVAGSTWNVGSIVGCIQPSSSALIENCVVTGGSVSSNNTDVGGLAGKLISGTLLNCSFSGTVSVTTASKNRLGGLIGQITDAACLVDGCVFSGTASSASSYVGGICGCMSAGARITGCRCEAATIQSTGGNCVGGIVGYMSGTDSAQRRIDNCLVDDASSVTAKTGQAGGILGGCESNAYVLINLCSAACDVSNTGSGAYGSLGGIAGIINTQNALIANCCYAGGSLSNTSGTSGGLGGIAGQLYATSMVNTTIFNCCAFPTGLSTGGSSNANLAGIAGLVNTATVRNAYSPTPASVMLFNGAASGSSRGSIYGWLRGQNTSDACSGKLLDVYWLSGFKAGNYNGNYTYVKSEQSLSDAQMQNTGSVTRPSTGVSYDSFIDALNADVAAWNASSPLYDVAGVTWVLGTNGYPVPSGTVLAPSLP